MCAYDGVVEHAYDVCCTQAACRLSHVANADNDHGSEDALYLPELSDDFQSLEPEINEHSTLERDIVRSSPVPAILDDSRKLTDTEQDLVTDSVPAADRYLAFKMCMRSSSLLT